MTVTPAVSLPIVFGSISPNMSMTILVTMSAAQLGIYPIKITVAKEVVRILAISVPTRVVLKKDSGLSRKPTADFAPLIFLLS